MRQAISTRQRRAEAFNREGLHLVLSSIGGCSLTDLRDASLLAVAYDTLCRRSELAALDLEHIERAKNGTGTAFIARRTGQNDEGDSRFLSADTMRRLTAWTHAAGISGGPLFRPLGQARKRQRLSVRTVSRIFKRRATRAALLGFVPSRRSARMSALQDAQSAGLSFSDGMQASSCKSSRVPRPKKTGSRRGGGAKLAALQRP